MDNTRVENAIQPFVVGRKNWVFSNTQLGQVLCSTRLLSLPVQMVSMWRIIFTGCWFSKIPLLGMEDLTVMITVNAAYINK